MLDDDREESPLECRVDRDIETCCSRIELSTESRVCIFSEATCIARSIIYTSVTASVRCIYAMKKKWLARAYARASTRVSGN